MILPKSLQTEIKQRVSGYYIIDSATQRQLVVTGTGLLVPGRCTLFPVVPINSRPTSKSSKRVLESTRARARAQKALTRHLRVAAKLKLSLTPPQLRRLEKTLPISPKIVSVKL
jgi:hypothetical protein